MAEKKNGGPAFPVPADGDLRPTHPGMTLRDYFAAHAPPWRAETYTGLEYGTCDSETLALWAYDYADAMIAQRAKTDEQS